MCGLLTCNVVEMIEKVKEKKTHKIGLESHECCLHKTYNIYMYSRILYPRYKTINY